MLDRRTGALTRNGPRSLSVPAATATARLREEHGGETFTVASVLPMAWPGLRRTDGSVVIGLQTRIGSGDASRDVA